VSIYEKRKQGRGIIPKVFIFQIQFQGLSGPDFSNNDEAKTKVDNERVNDERDIK
jgi:hypothetical protein